MTSLVDAAAVLLWVVVVVRLPTLVRNVTQRLLWVGLAALAIGVTLEIPDVARTLDELPGVGTNVSQLVKHGLVVVAAGAVREVVRGLALPAEVAGKGRGRRALAMTGLLALLASLFIVAPVHDRPLPGLTAAATGEPILLAYWAIYLLALGAALVSIAVLTWSSIKTFPPGPLRTGMGWMGAGAVVGLAYCAHKAVYLVASTVTNGAWPQPETMERVQAVLLAGTVMIFVVGVLWPASVRWPLVRHLLAYRAYRRLYPLWRAYYEAEPAIALDASAGSDHVGRPSVRDIEIQLYRRVIEIRDGMLAVRPFEHPGSRELALLEAQKAGYHQADLVGEAAWLELARRAKLRGHPPRSKEVPAASGGTDLASEIRVLTQIAKSQDAIQAVAHRVETVTETQTTP